MGGGVEQIEGAGVKKGRMFSSCIGGKRETGDSQGDGLPGKVLGKNCGGEVGEGMVSTGLGHSSNSETKYHTCQLIRKYVYIVQRACVDF